jgi:peptidase M48-like protein
MCDFNRARRHVVGSIIAMPLLLSGCDSGGDADSGDSQRPSSSPTPSRVPIGGAGCYRPQYAGAQPSMLACGVLPNFGDPAIDSQWVQEVQIQAQFFSPVPAQVYVLDECNPSGANAFALPEGYILFGRYFAAKLIQLTGSSLPIAGVLAHEWGHRAQFEHGWMIQTEPTVRRTELEADMWSGLYMGLAKLWTGPALQSFFQTLINLGDYNFNNPGHHGTPNQRYAAGATGLTLALQLLQTGTRLSYPQIHSIFLNEVTRITTTVQGEDDAALARKLALGAQNMTVEAKGIHDRMDTNWIAGIAAGRRSLSELRTLPLLPFDQRMNLAPY